jgi:hypothetical protein
MSTQRYPESAPLTRQLLEKGSPQARPSGCTSSLGHCEKDRILRAVLVGMLRRIERSIASQRSDRVSVLALIVVAFVLALIVLVLALIVTNLGQVAF